MARSRSFDGGFEDLPTSVLRALLVDRSYYTDALCKNPAGVPKIAWIATPGKKYKVGANIYDGGKLTELALQVCATCPVQWRCAAAALEADERAGVWGDTLDNLGWLENQGHHEQKLDLAKSTGVTVQRMITLLRAT